MSSSVFIESCTKAFKGGIESENEVEISGSPDSNLVVVYGKNGVNFDKRGIENLIEEKTLSSISVIRLSSPTPSMLDEEEEAEKADELLRRHAERLSDDESSRSSNNGSCVEGAEYSESDEVPTSEDEKSDADSDNSADNVKLENRKKKQKMRRKNRNTTKIQNMKNKKHKERPDIIGLTVEEFYPAVSAKEVVKEALKLAGVSTFKKTADYEFQMFVIKNDHCYTPFTSPAQMKAKLAEKYKAEKLAGRRIIPHTAVTMKQIQLKKKVIEGFHDHLDQSTHTNKDQQLKIFTKPAKLNKQTERDEFVEGEVDMHSSTAESDFDVLSDESGDTDNDRDSDLDFNVNNRKGRKKKDLVTKAKRLSAGKVCVKRIIAQQDDEDDQRNKNPRPITNNVFNRPNKTGLITKPGGCAPIAVQKLLSDAVAALAPIPKRSAAVQIDEREKVVNVSSRPQTIQSTIHRGPTIEIQHGIQKTPMARTHLQGSPQSVKEIVINKVMASPKGGFTELGELLSQTETKSSRTTPLTPTNSNKSPGLRQKNIPSPSKGFMPLGIETAAKNKLPIQISIQTHQSSSELAKSRIIMESLPLVQQNHTPSNESSTQCTGNEPSSSELASEHFDLIDSIVKDEMQKDSLMEVTSKSNENIPKLVKMLENAEQSLESTATNLQIDNNLRNFGTTSEGNVDDIDISNAPLLESSDGVEIPDDLLQQVVDLIEDDETLQEAVEKQVFSEEHNDEFACADSAETVNIVPTTTGPHQLTTTQVSASLQEPNQAKSIIEMAISNVPSSSIGTSSTGADMPVFVTKVATAKPMPSPTIRKEPIKIVRGNGRVITLPPIEAPTTRAKRRAQNQPANSSTIFNESSLDSSLQSNSSFTTVEQIPSGTVEKKTEAASKRRVSKESATGGTNASKAKKTVVATKKSTTAKNVASKSGAEEDASASQEDDDDPNRLWCICRQPHNNRFMICCDVCEDWFHGTCVSITKAMGIEMEQKGIDWTCPKCVKLQEEKKQRKITDMLIPRKIISEATIQKPEHEQIGTKAASANNLDSTVTNSSFESFLDTTQTTYISTKLQVGDVTPTKTTSKKVTKPNVSAMKKKPTTLNVKPKEVNTPASQTKRRLPVSQQAMKHQAESTKSSSVAQSSTSAQQAFKDLQKPIQAEAISTEPQTFCIVCKKVARSNSIYCSDDCIRKHAQNALNMFAAVSSAKSPEPTVSSNINEDAALKKKKAKGLFEDILSMADRKPKIERVHVIERKSGRILTGSNAPTTHNLKKWLQDNQTFEVVQPGSIQAQEIEKKQRHRQTQSLSPIVITNVGKHITYQPASTHTHNIQISQSPHGSNTVVVKSSTPQRDAELNVHVLKPVKQLIEQVVKAAPNSPRPGTPKQLQKYPQQVSLKPDKATRGDAKEEAKDRKEKPKQRSLAETVTKRQSDNAPSGSTNSEPIRLNVRRTLKEQLLLRMNETGSENENCNGTLPKLSIEQIEKFVHETEAEMYDYFSRDTGARYRAKYRSLMFNIKDRKNRTLFAKICANKIQPKQLVRMSPEELASQELAQWRENEAKHQLEMIKKSELDLLSCAKNYVLKTHKGEEVIEGKLEDCVNLDASIPVEDVVSVLNSSIVSSSSASDLVKADLDPNSFIEHQQSNETQATKIGSHFDEEKQKKSLQRKG
uniref:PHD finger protein 3 n=1 Tax=Bactrocera latifrons TaxID=174628 RepID=A0A0K8WM71_BACLA